MAFLVSKPLLEHVKPGIQIDYFIFNMYIMKVKTFLGLGCLLMPPHMVQRNTTCTIILHNFSLIRAF